MTTSVSRPLNSTEPTFSYAAAASGKHTAGTQNKSQSATSKVATPPMPQTQVLTTAVPSANGTTAPTIRTPTPHSTSVGDSNSKLTTDGGSVQNFSIPTSPSLGTASTTTLPKEDDATMTPLSVPDERPGAWDKHSQTSSHADHKSATTAGSRTPDAKVSELVPAAPPKINPWKVRQDELAKTKANSSAPATSELKVSTTTASNKPVTSEKQVESKQGDRKKRQTSGNWEGLDKEKSKDSNSVSGDKKDASARDRKKGADGGRANGYANKDDGMGATSSRNARSGKKGPQEREQTTPPPPPPVTDTSSWPTPETAQDEAEKVKKEKEEKEKERGASSVVKSGVSKWVSVPITTPYVSPFPSKSGRGRSNRGGREGGGRGGSNLSTQAGEKPAGAGSSSGAALESERTRSGPGTSSSRGGYQGGKGSKGPGSASSSTQRRESRVAMPGSPTEKRRDSVYTKDATDPTSSDRNTVGNISTGTQTERQRRESKDTVRGTDDVAFVGQGEIRHAELQERSQPNGHTFHPRSDRSSHQYYGNGRQDVGAEGTTSHPRERGSERGRGYRSRGGFFNAHYSNGHHNHTHHQNSPNSQYASASPSFHAHTNGQQYSTHGQPRVYRGSSNRSQSVSNGIYRYNPNMQQPPQYMQPYQIAYDYTMMASGALPNPNDVIMANVITQVNYYFSVDNLCKDMFLRKHMDNDGYVRLSVIARFNRLQNLTQDPTVIRDACLQSDEVQLATGLDDWHIRKKVGWENWVLNESEREQSARCGESSWHIDPRRNRILDAIAPSAPVFVPSGGYAPLASNTVGFAVPLSANVPEFSPSATFTNGSLPSPAGDYLPDSELDFLMVVTKKLGVSDSKNASPESSPPRPSRKAMQNDESSGFRSMSPEEPLSPSSIPGHVSRQSQSEVGWFMSADFQKEQESHDVLIHKPYAHFRSQCLKQREISGPGKNRDMVTLYKFWAHFLPKRFNGIMYNEFKKFSLEDAEVFARIGLEYLFKFYEEAIMVRQTVDEDLIRDFVILAKKDGKNGFATGPHRLKSCLANPSLRAHHKKSIEGLIDEELQNIIDVGAEGTTSQPLAESYLTGTATPA